MQLLDHYDIAVTTETGQAAFEGEFVQPVAEAIVRSLLWGRSTFSVSSDRDAMIEAVSSFISWIADIEIEVDRLIADSALGTGYEDALKAEVFAKLGVHPLAGAKQLPNEIRL